LIKCTPKIPPLVRFTPHMEKSVPPGSHTGSVPARLGSAWLGLGEGWGSARPGPARPGSARLGPARGSARLGSARLGSSRLGLGLAQAWLGLASVRLGLAQLGSAWLRSAWLGLAQFSSAWLDLARSGSDVPPKVVVLRRRQSSFSKKHAFHVGETILDFGNVRLA
jgi:predicted small integral membrane protein